MPLPEDPPWWELFDVKKADMYTVCRELQALYDRPKVAYISVWKEKKAAPSPRGEGAGEAETTPQVRRHRSLCLATGTDQKTTQLP